MKKTLFFIIVYLLFQHNCISQIIEIEDAVVFYNQNNYTGNTYVFGFATPDNEFFEDFTIPDWGAASHRSIPIIRYQDGIEYHVTIQGLRAYTLGCSGGQIIYSLSTHQVNYDAYCIDFSYFPLCICSNSLNWDYTSGKVEYRTHTQVPKFSVKNKTEHRKVWLDSPTSNNGDVKYIIYCDTDDDIELEGSTLSSDKNYGLWVEKYYPFTDYSGRYGTQYLTITDKTAIINGSFDLKSWCLTRGLDISQPGYYYIRLLEHYTVDGIINYFYENPKELWVKECHPNRVINSDITENMTKRAEETIEISGIIRSSADNVVLMAGQEILFNPGFHIETGVNFEAKIESCSSGF